MEFCKSACLVLRTSRWNDIRRFDTRVNMSLIDNGYHECASETEMSFTCLEVGPSPRRWRSGCDRNVDSKGGKLIGIST